MAYKELKSLYYGKSDEYAKEYLTRFESEECVKTGFYIGDHQSFFLQNAEIMTLAFNIAKLDKSIGKLCTELPRIALEQYSKKCLIDEIVLTNKIEGVHSSRKEISEALDILENQANSKKGKKSRFVGLVNKYSKLLSASQIPLQECTDIRNIYDEVFLDEVILEDETNHPDGKLFRKESVSVYSETGKEIHRGVYPEEKIIEKMDSALKFLNDDSIEALFRICIFHFFIEHIHPFYDGNGRIGRFILSYGISQTLSPLIAFRISETIKENVKTYYKAFQSCNDQRNLGDLTPFLQMQLSMILAAMEDLQHSLESRKLTWNKYEKAVQKYHAGDPKLALLYSLLIQAALFSEMGISTQELENHLQCSKYIRIQLMEKIPEKLLEVKKKGNNKFFEINLNELDHIILGDGIEQLGKSTTDNT